MTKDEALKLAIFHIEHMAKYLSNLKAGYSFEALGEDMPGIRATLEPFEPWPAGPYVKSIMDTYSKFQWVDIDLNPGIVWEVCFQGPHNAAYALARAAGCDITKAAIVRAHAIAMVNR